jgi:hypothetical protein
MTLEEDDKRRKQVESAEACQRLLDDDVVSWTLTLEDWKRIVRRSETHAAILKQLELEEGVSERV